MGTVGNWRENGGDWTSADRSSLQTWYAERGSRDVTYAMSIGQPLPPLPIAGHANCRVRGCAGYTRSGTVCVDHFPRSVG